MRPARSSLFRIVCTLAGVIGLGLAQACGGGGGDLRDPGQPEPTQGWTGPQVLETNLLFNSRAPSVAVGPAGNAFVAWERERGGTYEFWGKRFLTAGGWQAEGTYTSLNGSNMNPKVAVNGTGTYLFAWERSQSTTESEIYVNRYVPGAGLDEPLRLNTGFGSSPALAVNAAGDACVVWMEVGSSSSQVMASRFKASTLTWTAPFAVSTSPSPYALWPSVAMDAAQNIVVLWSEATDPAKGPFSLRMARFNGQSWSAPLSPQVGNGPVDANYALAMSASGAQLAWLESLDAGTSFQVYSCRWTAGNDTLSAPKRVSLATEDTFAPSVGLDAQGNAVLVWVQAAGADLYTASFSNASGWQLNPQPLAVGTAGLGVPKLAMNETGHTAVVWQQGSATTWGIRAARWEPGTGWSAPTALNTGAGACYSPDISIGTGNQILAAWYQLDAQGVRHIIANQHK